MMTLSEERGTNEENIKKSKTKLIKKNQVGLKYMLTKQMRREKVGWANADQGRRGVCVTPHFWLI